MSSASRAELKERLIQALFDMLDEMEADLRYKSTPMSIQKEAETLADAVFNVITDTDDEDLAITELFPIDEVSDAYGAADEADTV